MSTTDICEAPITQRWQPSIAERARAIAVDGVVSVAELRGAGLSAHMIAMRCREGGPWQRPLSKVVLLHNKQPTRKQFLRAVLAQLGHGTVITGVDALRQQGAGVDFPHGPVHVLVPANRRASSATNLVIERTTRPPQVIDMDGLAFAAPARACIDAARRETSHARLCALLFAPLDDALCDPEELRAEIDKGSQRGAAGPRAALRDLTGKLFSLTEQRARRTVEASRVPKPDWHVPLTDASGELLTVVSAYWPEVELSWDTSPAGHHKAILSGTGRRVVHTPPALILREPEKARAMVETAYRAAAHAMESNAVAGRN